MLRNKKFLAMLFLGLSCFFFLPFLSQKKILGEGLSKAVSREMTALGAEDSGNSDSEALVTCKLSECTICDLYKLVTKIFNWLLGLSFAVAVLFTVVSGFLYILSVGDSGFMSMAKEGLKYSLIGFAICLTSWLAIHTLFTIMGTDNKGDWWTIQCDDSGGGSETGQEANVSGSLASQKTDVNGNPISQNKITNEVAVKMPGGRENPISLPRLATDGIGALPENKYFFIHGLGGQSIESAAKQLTKIAQEADSTKKLVFAAVPEKNLSEATTASTLINLNSYLSQDPEVLKQEIQKLSGQIIENNPEAEAYVNKIASLSTEDRFAYLASLIAQYSSSREIPLIIADSADNVSMFSNIWPVNTNSYVENKNGLSKTVATIDKDGLLYADKIPLAFNGDVLPNGGSNFMINVVPKDGGGYILDPENPVSITLPDNISPEAAVAATEKFAKALKMVQEKEEALDGESEDIIDELTSLLYKDNFANEQKNSKKASPVKDFFEMSLDEYTKSLDGKDQGSNGTSFLPAGIATNSTTNTDNTDTANTENTTPDTTIKKDNIATIATNPVIPKIKQINQDLEQELNKWIKDVLNKNNGDRSSSISSEPIPSTAPPVGNIGKDSTRPVGDTFQGVPNPAAEAVTGIAADPNSMVSLVSVGINRQLSTEERGHIRDLIVNIQKEEFEKYQQDGKNVPLNIPVDYVMCLMQLESSSNPMAHNESGAAGLGQFTLDSQEQAAKLMQRKSPKHYEEFSKKYGKDLATLMSTTKSGYKNVKDTLKKDANLAAALTYDFIQFKAEALKIKAPIGNDNNKLQRITHAYIYDGNEESQWQGIKTCKDNNGWVPKPPKPKNKK